jgi:hypothetical protein
MRFLQADKLKVVLMIIIKLIHTGILGFGFIQQAREDFGGAGNSKLSCVL